MDIKLNNKWLDAAIKNKLDISTCDNLPNDLKM